MSVKKKIELQPIGFVKTKAVGNQVKDKNVVSQIILWRGMEEVLDGIKDFSHVFVIFWMHGISEEERKTTKVHPRGREDMPLLGVLATRAPLRPNPIGLTLVRLLEIRSNILIVRGLDAFDGTPILDIKPFDQWDMAEDVRVPEWLTKLENE